MNPPHAFNLVIWQNLVIWSCLPLQKHSVNSVKNSPMTVLELLENTTRYFAKHEVPSPRLTIELMLADILQKTRMQLYLEFDQPVSERDGSIPVGVPGR